MSIDSDTPGLDSAGDGTLPGAGHGRLTRLAALYWAAMITVSIAADPVDGLLGRFIQVRSEYSLIEQSTKFFLLAAIAAALLANTRARSASEVRSSAAFLLFYLAEYFSESNFIVNAWQPFIGIFLLVMISRFVWTNRPAVVTVWAGAAVVAAGTVSDMLREHADRFPDWWIFARWETWAPVVEEWFDLWGTAIIGFAVFVAFRDLLFARSRTPLRRGLLAVLSLGLIAAGNGFAHWQYDPTAIFENIAAVLIMIGLAGLYTVDKATPRDDLILGYLDRKIVHGLVITLFFVLPLIYGGTRGPVNLVLGVGFLWIIWRSLLRAHPLTRLETQS